MQYNKINDIDKCPCGTEVPYKYCCKNKVFLEMFKTQRKTAERLNVFEDCCVPMSQKHLCSKTKDNKTEIINAHTVTKSKSLKHIASTPENKVYYFRNELNYFNISPYKLKSVGIKKASTFKGFCSYHDSSMFKCIEENNEFRATCEQIFYLSFRSIAQHYSKTRISIKGEKYFNLLISKYIPAIDNWFLSEDEIKRLMEFRRHTAMSYNEFEHTTKVCSQYLERFHKSIDKKNFNCLEHYIFEIKGVFPIQCCGCCSPIIINPSSSTDMYPLKFFFINYFYEDSTKRSYAVFSWFKEDEECKYYVYQNLIKKDNMAVLFSLITFNFNSIDNFFIQKYWWNKLPKSSKDFFEDTLNTFSIVNNIDNEKLYQTFLDFKKHKIFNGVALHRHGIAVKYNCIIKLILRMLRSFHVNLPIFNLLK